MSTIWQFGQWSANPKKNHIFAKSPKWCWCAFFLQRIEAMIHWISKTWCSTPDYWICIGERRVGGGLGSIFWCGHLDQEGGGLSWTKRGCQQDIHPAPVHNRRKISSRVHITFCHFVRLPESNVLGRYLNKGNVTTVENNLSLRWQGRFHKKYKIVWDERSTVKTDYKRLNIVFWDQKIPFVV